MNSSPASASVAYEKAQLNNVITESKTSRKACFIGGFGVLVFLDSFTCAVFKSAKYGYDSYLRLLIGVNVKLTISKVSC